MWATLSQYLTVRLSRIKTRSFGALFTLQTHPKTRSFGASFTYAVKTRTSAYEQTLQHNCGHALGPSSLSCVTQGQRWLTEQSRETQKVQIVIHEHSDGLSAAFKRVICSTWSSCQSCRGHATNKAATLLASAPYTAIKPFEVITSKNQSDSKFVVRNTPQWSNHFEQQLVSSHRTTHSKGYTL